MRGRALAVALLLAALPVAAQALYKWTDDGGKVHYSDRPPPKGFAGKVERIEPDVQPPAVERVVPAPQARPATPAAPAGLATQRRANREALQARVDAARGRVEAARKALAEGADIAVEDRRTFVQRVDGPPAQAMALRSNCHVVKGSDGKDVTLCASSIPNDAYRERVEKLEEALRTAEDELSEAQSAYRRGAD